MLGCEGGGSGGSGAVKGTSVEVWGRRVERVGVSINFCGGGRFRGWGGGVVGVGV